MTTRHRGREVALQMLFQFDSCELSREDVVRLYRDCFGDGPLPDEFSVQLFYNVTGKLVEIDSTIEKSSDHWRLERMSKVDRNILRIGVAEILDTDEVPTRVAINEAVELAKRFGTAESPSFVNGILDRVARDGRKI